VLTDSGGVQDETSALGVACYTLRTTTDRLATVLYGTNVLLGEDPAEIASIELTPRPQNSEGGIPLWDGRAADRVAKTIWQRLTLGQVS
jgi:UDP-N-acetylglucosamine 2-epimerase (non-hydrolysing)